MMINCTQELNWNNLLYEEIAKSAFVNICVYVSIHIYIHINIKYMK